MPKFRQGELVEVELRGEWTPGRIERVDGVNAFRVSLNGRSGVPAHVEKRSLRHPTPNRYRLVRNRSGQCGILRVVQGEAFPIDSRLDLANHSPTGFEWGYGGSGPAQTAVAILADFTGDDCTALARYQDFKFRVVSRLDCTAADQVIEAEAIESFLAERQPQV